MLCSNSPSSSIHSQTYKQVIPEKTQLLPSVFQPNKIQDSSFQEKQHSETQADSPKQTEQSSGLKNMLWLFLNIAGISLISFFGLMFLIKIAGWLTQKGQEIELSRISWAGLSVLFTIAPVFLIYFGGSQAETAKSWRLLLSPMKEGGFFSSNEQNLYRTDYAGNITRLKFNQSSLPNFQNLAGIENLTSLKELEIQISSSGAPETAQLNSIDLGIFKKAKNLESLTLDGLNLSQVENIEVLTSVKKLYLPNCSSVTLERINQLRELNDLNLTGTDVKHLDSLGELSNLRSLSIANTSVNKLDGLENLNLLSSLDIRGTSLDAQEVRKFFNHPVMVFPGGSAVKPEINPDVWSWLKPLGLILLLLSVISLLPLKIFIRRRSILLAQRIFRNLMFGLGLLWAATFAAFLERPNDSPSLQVLENRWWFLLYIGIWLTPWLVIRPLILLLLEMRRVGSSIWSVSLKLFARVIPILTILFPFAFLVIDIEITLIANSQNILALIFLIPVFFVFLGILYWIVIIVIPGFRARRRLKLFKQLCQGEDDELPKVVEIPLNAAPFVISLKPSRVAISRFIKRFFKTELEYDFELLSVPSVAVVSHAPVFQTVKDNFLGVMILLPRAQLAFARNWEMDGLREWIQSMYQHSVAPIWVIGDWFGELAPGSSETERHSQTFISLQPYLSGLVRLPSVTNALSPSHLPVSINDCLNANKLTNQETLHEMGLKYLTASAFTPVAVLLRSVFGQADLTDRLDVLFRALEAAAAFWSLLFVIEFEDNEAQNKAPLTAKQEKIRRGIERTFKGGRGLMFKDWESLLNNFSKNSDSFITTTFAAAFDMPCQFSYSELREKLFVINEQAANSLPSEIETIKQLLSLLIALRNVTTAHGSATQAASADLYIEVVAATVEILGALPWDKAMLMKIESNGFPVYYCGCFVKPDVTGGKYEEKNQTLIFIDDENEQDAKLLNAEKYFRVIEQTRSVAIYTGEKNFFDLLFGVRRSE